MINIDSPLSPSYSDTSCDYSGITMASNKSWVQRTFGKMEQGSIRSSIIALLSCAMGSGMLAFPCNDFNFM